MPFIGGGGGGGGGVTPDQLATAIGTEVTDRNTAIGVETTNRTTDTATRAVKLTNASVVTAAGPTTVAVNTIVPVDTTSNAVGITLPTAPADGSRIVLKHIIQGGTNAVTVTAGGSDKFNKAGGSTSKTLVLLNQAMNLQYAATPALWYVVSEDMPLLAMDGRYMPIVEGVNTVAAAGASQTLAAVTTATVNDLTLTENCAITLPAATAGTSFVLLLRQGGTGSYTVTFTPTPKWANGAVPVLSTAVGALDVITGFYVTAWNLGVVGLAFA